MGIIAPTTVATTGEESGESSAIPEMQDANNLIVQTLFQSLIQSVDRDAPRVPGSNAEQLPERTLSWRLWEFADQIISPSEALVSDRFFSIMRDENATVSEQKIFAPEAIDKVVVGSTAVVTTSLSVGYVVWILRGGSVLTTFMSALPAWHAFDPLPILQSAARRDEDDADDDSLLSIATRRMKSPKPKPQIDVSE